MLKTVDLDLSLERPEYKKRLLQCQLRMRGLARRLYEEKRSLVVVVEGWDAAGKGGAIRRFTEKIDPRGYQVYSIAAPHGDDRTHHYLWRFWRRLQPAEEKQILIFDRSWYGRVLVERVEGFATEPEWQRAFREINEFEHQLTDHGVLLAKLWFHVSEKEQLRRFEERRDTPHKSWKLTGEDWRNREKWGLYEVAAIDILQKTSTLTAPWTVVEGNDKLFARVKFQQTLVDLLAHHLEPADDPADSKAESKPKSGKKKNKK